MTILTELSLASQNVTRALGKVKDLYRQQSVSDSWNGGPFFFENHPQHLSEPARLWLCCVCSARQSLVIGLQRSLVRYSASVETTELKTRVIIERLDRQRADFIQRLMERSAACVSLVVSVVTMEDAPREAGPEFMYMMRYGEIAKSLHLIGRELTTGAHLFDRTEPLLDLGFDWLADQYLHANRFYDSVTAIVASDGYWSLEFADRARLLETARGLLLPSAPDSKALFANFLNQCRSFTVGAED